MELTFGRFLKRTTLRILAQLRLLIFDGVLFLSFTKGFFLYCIVLGLLYYCVAVRGAQIDRSGVLLSCAARMPPTFLPYPAPTLETDF